MGNVLGNLFGDIAAAIREKTGDTATMKPAEFPEKISAIETGGGSLSSGVYLSTPIANGIQYAHSMFILNGVRYAACVGGTLTTTSAAVARIFKYNNGTWETVLDSGSNSCVFPSSITINYSYKGIIYHNKMHFFTSTSHGAFDGTSVEAFTKLSNVDHYPFVYNDKLLSYDASAGNIIEWNESSDTWTTFVTMGTKYYYYYPIVINNTLYFVRNKNVYRYSDNGLVQLDITLPNDPDSRRFIHNNAMYWIALGKTQSYVYKYDFVTNVASTVGMIPNFLAVSYTITENMDEMSFVGYTASSNDRYPEYMMHIVEEST